MKIGLMGLGTVGRGAYDVIRERGLGLEIGRILTLRVRPGWEALMTTDPQEMLREDIDAVVELIGGLHPAYEYVTAAMRAGKHVVTANKALVSRYYKELHACAQNSGVQFRYTAAVGGGIPWLYNLRRAARCNAVHRIDGVFNGTTNFILEAMRTGREFASALREAQDLGYAEADPSSDIDGLDAQRKCVISANLAFHCVLEEKDVPVRGIGGITREDVAFWSREGYVCRLMAHAAQTAQGIFAYVEPSLVPQASQEAIIPGCYNLISLTADKLGVLRFFGQGAGREPTGSAVVQDLLDIAEGMRFCSPGLSPARLGGEEAHRYFVRQGEERRFTERPVCVRDMHAGGADFFAGIEERAL